MAPLFALLALALACFQGHRDAVQQQLHQDQEQRKAQQEECERRDGYWQKRGFFHHTCAFRMADAGRKCTDSTQCEGVCVATGNVAAGELAEGQCSWFQHGPNCTALVEQGRAGEAECYD